MRGVLVGNPHLFPPFFLHFVPASIILNFIVITNFRCFPHSCPAAQLAIISALPRRSGCKPRPSQRVLDAVADDQSPPPFDNSSLLGPQGNGGVANDDPPLPTNPELLQLRQQAEQVRQTRRHTEYTRREQEEIEQLRRQIIKGTSLIPSVPSTGSSSSHVSPLPPQIRPGGLQYSFSLPQVPQFGASSPPPSGICCVRLRRNKVSSFFLPRSLFKFSFSHPFAITACTSWTLLLISLLFLSRYTMISSSGPVSNRVRTSLPHGVLLVMSYSPVIW